jgi:hypothetical protein
VAEVDLQGVMRVGRLLQEVDSRREVYESELVIGEKDLQDLKCMERLRPKAASTFEVYEGEEAAVMMNRV